MQPDNSDAEFSEFFSIPVNWVCFCVSLVCVFFGIIWSLFFFIRLLLSLYRNRKIQKVKGEIDILTKAVSSTSPVQNLLLFLICVALTFLFVFINFSNYRIIIFSSATKCKSKSEHLNALVKDYGSALVLASLMSGIIRILLNSYISAFSANQSQSQAKPHLVVLTLFAAFAMLGFTVPFTVLYTSFVVLTVFLIHSFVICYKMYQLHKLLLESQIKTTGLSRDTGLFSEIRCYRLESELLAIPVCAFHAVVILLFTCSTALSTKLIEIVLSNPKQCDNSKLRFMHEIGDYIGVSGLIFSIITIVLSLVVIIPGVAYTIYFVVKECRYKLLAKKSIVSGLNEPLMAQ